MYCIDVLARESQSIVLPAVGFVYLWPAARCIGYRGAVCLWASADSPTQAHAHGMLSLQHFAISPTAHDSENYSRLTSSTHHLSLSLSVMHACTCM